MRLLKLLSPTALRIVFLIFVGGCTSFQPDAPLGTEAYRQGLRILVQICMPTVLAQEYLSTSRIHRFGSRGELRSIIGGAEKRIGLSASGEPVFELFTHDRIVDLVAVMVDVDNTTYTYEIGKAKPILESWTKWEAPQSQNSHNEMISYRIANGKDFNVKMPDREAPKVRYRLIKTADWWNDVSRQNDDRPACW